MRHQPIYVFDIDGTLANGDHRIHHIYPPEGQKRDWNTYFSLAGKDEPIPHMVQLCQILSIQARVIFVSGRRHETFEDTHEWLQKHVGIWIRRTDLFMRAKDDYRDDNIIKVEILEKLRDVGIHPTMVFDDRTRVVKAWRDAGVPCAQVAPGDY